MKLNKALKRAVGVVMSVCLLAALAVPETAASC